MNITIQNAGIKDLNSLRQLEEICFPLDRWPLFDLIGVLTLPGIIRKKAVEDDRFIGFVAGDVHKRQAVGWITTIATIPAYRGLGVGKKLLAACEEEMQISTILLSVRKSNQAAINMYLNCGYTQKEIWPAYYYGGEDGIVFEKKI
jgi:ribosomal protein S18 acetylase RimI-like enzyme